MLQGCIGSQTRASRRSTSTFVFPDPAAADTSKAPPEFSTTARCDGVKTISAMFLFLLLQFLPEFSCRSRSKIALLPLT